MRVLYFGTYDRAYPRNAQVISALRGADVEVQEEHRSVWQQRHNWSAGPPELMRLTEAQWSLRRTRSDHEGVDAVIVGYPGHFDLGAAAYVARGRPVVFNPLVSLSDTLVDDRARFRPGSLGARLVGHIDRRAFRRADVVVADTEAHAQFFRDRFALSEAGVETCFVGAEDRLFRPERRPAVTFHALFVGKLIPLHGLETILAAAALAPEIPFRIVGSGQLEPLLAGRPANVTSIPWVEYEDLPAEVHAAGCALGVFGTGAKASRVIPNKAFQALACGTPLVTADTPGARELLTDGADALLVPPGDPAALAAAVRRLAGDPTLAQRIGASGRETYARRASEPVLGAQWRDVIERAVAAS